MPIPMPFWKQWCDKCQAETCWSEYIRFDTKYVGCHKCGSGKVKPTVKAKFIRRRKKHGK